MDEINNTHVSPTNANIVLGACASLGQYDLEINGVKYQQIPKESNSNTNHAMSMLMISIISMGFPMLGGSRGSTKPSVNIVEEFELIQNKKSNLSKSERDWVVSQFNMRFARVS